MVSWLRLERQGRLRQGFDGHILPALGSFKVRKLHRGVIKTLLAEKQAAGFAPDSVRLIYTALRRMLDARSKTTSSA